MKTFLTLTTVSLMTLTPLMVSAQTASGGTATLQVDRDTVAVPCIHRVGRDGSNGCIYIQMLFPSGG